MEHLEGIHGREMGPFLCVVHIGGEERWKLGLLCGWEKHERLLANWCVFRFHLGPILLDSYPWLGGDTAIESEWTWVYMVGRNVLGLQLVGESLLEKISALCFFCIMYIPMCLYLSLKCNSMCMLVGYLVCMACCSFIGWLTMGISRVTLLLRVIEHGCLWWGGTSLVCNQLVNLFLKI